MMQVPIWVKNPKPRLFCERGCGYCLSSGPVWRGLRTARECSGCTSKWIVRIIPAPGHQGLIKKELDGCSNSDLAYKSVRTMFILMLIGIQVARNMQLTYPLDSICLSIAGYMLISAASFNLFTRLGTTSELSWLFHLSLRLLIKNLLFTYGVLPPLMFIVMVDMGMEILMQALMMSLIACEIMAQQRSTRSYLLISRMCPLCNVQESWTRRMLERNLTTFGKYNQEKCVHCWGGWAEGQEVATLHCIYVYHLSCLRVWIKESANAVCPICHIMISSSTYMRDKPKLG